MAQTKFKIQNLKFKITTMVFRVFFIIILFLFSSQISLAQFNYVLPYPSSMPGSLLYKSHLIYENLSRYWYFGDFGQFYYNLKLTDKYLVEAKTLFEYKQYLLGFKALKKSDQYFVRTLPNLVRAERNGKNVLFKKEVFTKASLKHMEVLRGMEKSIPSAFVWEPERSTPTTLNLKESLNKSIELRKKDI